MCHGPMAHVRIKGDILPKKQLFIRVCIPRLHHLLCVQREHISDTHAFDIVSIQRMHIHYMTQRPLGKSQLSSRETQFVSLPPSEITHSRNLVELVLPPAPEALTTGHDTPRPRESAHDTSLSSVVCLPTKKKKRQLAND